MAQAANTMKFKRWLAGAGVTEEEVPEGLMATGASTPNSGWLKADIQKWLTDHDIAYEEDDTKADLLALVPEE